MRIGIDGTTLCDTAGGRGAGIEHYTWSIVFTMATLAPQHQFIITVPKYFGKDFEQQFVGKAKNIKLIRPFLPRIPLFSRHVGMAGRFLLAWADVVFGPAGQLPLAWMGKSVITIHDASIFEHPEWFPKEQASGFSTSIVVPHSMKQANRIIAVSAFTRDQLERQFPYTKNKIDVIHEGVSVPSQITPLTTTNQILHPGIEDIILYLGTIEPRKNIENAVKAFDAFLQLHPDRAYKTRFVLAGKFGWKTEKIISVINNVNLKWNRQIGDDVVQPIGYVTEQEKWALLSQASALLFVSWEEGFGLPLIEALSVGTPVIASNRGSLPEIGGDAALFVEPHDIENISLAIAQCVLVPDGVRKLVKDGKQHAATFTWERAAEQTIRILESI